MLFIGLDFETWAPRSIKEVGLDNYVNQDGFMVLAASLHKLESGAPWLYVNEHVTFDFLADPLAQTKFLERMHSTWTREGHLTAHNSAFEEAVMNWLTHGEWAKADQMFIDSAVISRCMGAGSSLASASRQLLGEDKFADGERLVRKFSLCPTPPTWAAVENDPDWQLFVHTYNRMDAELSAQLAAKYFSVLDYIGEWGYQLTTDKMNVAGWKVDLEAVHAMKRWYEDNKRTALEEFREQYDPSGKLNVNSLPQMKIWCRERGVNATSFSEEAVEKLLGQVSKRLNTATLTSEQYSKLYQVNSLLNLKQVLGGSSLTKLDRIIKLTSADGRLRHQYMHCGAGQTYRTSGTGVQMQNLKRLAGRPSDMDEIHNSDSTWTNEELASNLRQVFTASHPDGRLIVGDFKSVESRGLAWLAGETWKLDAYRDGQEVYKMQAAKIYNVPYANVTYAQRTNGKVGELSCGYGAGPEAVRSFAQGMHIDMSEDDAVVLVTDWRDQCPKTVQLWNDLDEGLHSILTSQDSSVNKRLGCEQSDVSVEFKKITTPQPLLDIHPGAQSIQVQLYVNKRLTVSRVIHGLYQYGRDICYYKPSKTLSGPPWVSWFMNPKTKRRQRYKIYGGKLTGILVQSLCRELFFHSLTRLMKKLDHYENLSARIVGQFHDEIVVDWSPESGISEESVVGSMRFCMTSTPDHIHGFPLDVDIHSDFRYIK